MNRTHITSEILDRLPPQDVEAERCLLGSVLLLPKVLEDVLPIVQAEHFYDDANARLFRHMKAFADQGKRLDERLLVNVLRKAGELEAIGGMAYLQEIAVSVPYAHNAVYYAEIIRERAHRRALIASATEMLRDAWDLAQDVPAILDQAESALTSIGRGKLDSGPVSIATAVMESMNIIDELRSRQSRCGVLCGMYPYDRDIGGLFPGELTVVAARPGQGKSAIMAQWAFHIAGKGRRVYLASIEMSQTDLATRQLCAVSGVSNQKIRTGELADDDLGLLVEAAEKVASANLVIHDYPRLNPLEIRRAARREKAEIIFVDYMQLVQAPDKTKKRHEQVGEICKELRAIARELKVPMVVAAQLNRQADQMGKGDPRPRLSQLKESGSIEEDSDVVLLLYRPEEKIIGKERFSGQTWDAELKVAKNRKGNTPRFRLLWDKNRTQFEITEPEKRAERYTELDGLHGEDDENRDF